MYLAAILLNATISAAPAAERPRIDGRLDDAVWQGPAAISGLATGWWRGRGLAVVWYASVELAISIFSLIYS